MCVREVVVMLHCCRYQLRYQESIPCEQLVMQLCDLKQQYTQFGGRRYNSYLIVMGHFRRSSSVRCVYSVHGMGPSFWLPTVPK